ncbi:ShlB/FhaC/HecB family hemolysin secretion/activation protein [Alcaligenaceae bacterium A4P071]|nr:ShlB/FhaC/HecB family hemolysin secretion/activation protein [Alcaligenaceae bacterium A4P071]
MSLRFLISACPLQRAALGLTIAITPLCTQAASPLRGNPVDSVPRIESPPDQTPTPAPAVQAPTPQQQAMQARLAQQIIPRNFDVTGVRSIDFNSVTAILTPLANRTVTLGELIVEVDKITALYRAQGYPLSFALLQNQNFENGLVVVTVIEGHVGDVQIDGDIGRASSRLKSLAEPLLAEKPLTQATLERTLNLMRTVPGVTITPALDLPRRSDGASTLAIKAERQAFTATGGLADLGTGLQPLATVAANSLTPLGEQLRLTSSVPLASDDVRYIQGEVTVPIGNQGTAIKLDGYHYRAEPSDEAVQALGFDRRVRNNRIGLGVSHPFLLNNRQSLTGTFGVYAVDSSDLYTQRGGDRTLEQDTRVRAATVEMRYFQVSDTRSSEIKLGVSRGVDGLGARKTIESNYGYSAVPDVDLNFTRANLDLRQTFTLPAQFGVVLAGTGQYSDNTLPSSEQISFGSWRYGMGYPQGEKSGDKGFGLSAELNRRFATGWSYVSSVQPYALVDYAKSWYNSAALSTLRNRNLSSAALGVRFTDDKYYLLDFNVAKPTGAVPTNGDRDLRFNANYTLFYGAR